MIIGNNIHPFLHHRRACRYKLIAFVSQLDEAEATLSNDRQHGVVAQCGNVNLGLFASLDDGTSLPHLDRLSIKHNLHLLLFF